MRWWGKQVRPPSYGPEAEDLALVAADGTPIHAVRLRCTGGAAPEATVVLVHGITNSSRSPRVHAFAHLLAEWSDVLVPDLRGHGRSGGRCTMGEREPMDVAACIAVAEVRPVVLVGTSLGGLTAVLTAARVPVLGTYSLSAPTRRAVERPGAATMHRLTSTWSGRLVARAVFRTRIQPGWWDVDDLGDELPGDTAGFTVVAHDPDDRYFGPDQAEHLLALVPEPKALWWLPGTGHGGDLLTPALAARLRADLRRRAVGGAG